MELLHKDLTDIILNKQKKKLKEDFSDFEDKVSIFYKSITAENFVQLQLDNRKIWENYFTKEGYFVSLHSQLQKQFL